MQCENRLGELIDSTKHNSIHITGVLEEKTKNRAENLFQSIIENFPNLGKETDIQIQEAQRMPIKVNKSRPVTRHN